MDYKALTEALIKAKEAARAAGENIDDGGTCKKALSVECIIKWIKREAGNGTDKRRTGTESKGRKQFQ